VISLGLSAFLGVVIFAQSRHWIEKVDLLIIAGITLAIIFPASLARWTYNPGGSILVAAGLVAIALTTLFRLIYKLLT